MFSSRSSISFTGAAELARQEAGEHGVLDAALDAIAAADIDVLMHAHAVERHAQGTRDLVGVLRHLDRGPHVQHLPPRVPARHDTEGLDRHGGAAPPFHAIGELVRSGGESCVDIAPDEAPVEQHIRAVLGMHRDAAGPVGSFRIEHERQLLVLDADFLARVLGQRPRLGHDDGHPLAGIARPPDRQRIALHLGRIDADQQRIGRRRQLAALDHGMDARHGQRLGGIDLDDARAGVGRGQHRGVPRAGRRHVADVGRLAADEPAVLAHPALARDVLECRRLAHAHVPPVLTLALRKRSAASAMASTIWP